MNCDEMKAIASFAPLRCLLVIFITVALIAIPLILTVIRRIIKNPLYHVNTRVLMVAHGVGLIVHHVDRLVFHGWDLYRWMIVMPQATACDIISSSERCFGLRLMFNCAMWFCICTTPALTLERWLATRRTSTYHLDKHSWILALGFQFLLAAGLLSLVYAEQKFGGTALYCMAASSSFPLHTLIAFFLTTVVQSISIFVFKKLVKKNENLRLKLQQSGGNLIKKYQVEETLRALRTISQPVHIMFVAQFSYSFVSFFVLNFNSYFSRPVYFFLMELNIYIPEYSIFFALSFILKENKISRLSSASLKQKMQVDTDVYFENYKNSWK